MPEGETPQIASPEPAKQHLPPNPITHTDNGSLRRRDNPHGLSLQQQAAIGFDRTLQRVDNAIGRITDSPQESVVRDEATGQEPVLPSPIDAPVPHEVPTEHQTNSEEDPRQLGPDMSPSTLGFMHMAHRVGEFFQRHLVTPFIGKKEAPQPMVRRPQFEYTHEMRVQRSTSAPSNVRVLDQQQEPPFDWANQETGDSKLQNKPTSSGDEVASS